MKTEIPKIVLPHGGYKSLIVYRKSDLIYEGTVVFCRRFLPKFGNRTVDQMTQAARDFARKHPEWSDWKPLLDSRPPETVALAQRAADLRRAVDQAAWAIRKKKGWD